MRITSRLRTDDTGDYLACPCGSWYTHLEKVGRFHDMDGRLAARLEFSCELCPDGFTVEIVNYKGHTGIGVVGT